MTHPPTLTEIPQTPSRSGIATHVLRRSGIQKIRIRCGQILCCQRVGLISQCDQVYMSDHVVEASVQRRTSKCRSGRVTIQPRCTQIRIRPVLRGRTEMTHLPAGKWEAFLTYCPRARQAGTSASPFLHGLLEQGALRFNPHLPPGKKEPDRAFARKRSGDPGPSHEPLDQGALGIFCEAAITDRSRSISSPSRSSSAR
jgi:hypothetical protein